MFADNDQISSRQLQRQMVLTFLGIVLFFLPGSNVLQGAEGVVSVLIVWIFLCVYSIYLVRLGPVYAHPNRYLGHWISRGMGVLYLLYLITSGGYLVGKMVQAVGKYLLPQTPGMVIAVFLVLTCLLGKAGDIQGRGRMAELCYPVVLVLLAILLFVLFRNGLWTMRSLPDFPDIGKIKNGVWGLLGAFMGISLVPFCLGAVQKPGRQYGKIVKAISILGVVLLMAMAAFQSAFGTQGQPRYGLFSFVFLLFLLLFTLKSLFFYSAVVAKKTGLGIPAAWTGAAVYLLSVLEIEGVTIMDVYEKWLSGIWVPALLLLSLLLGITVTFTGCGGTEPENRALPLAMGVDYRDGQYEVFYAMSDMAKATGQGKEGNTTDRNWVQKGKTPEEINKTLRRLREKTLDLSHVSVLILGRDLLAHMDKTGAVISFLQKDTTMQEDMPVVWADTLDGIMQENDATEDSIGTLIRGVLDKQADKTATLGDVYISWSEAGSLPPLSGIRVEGKEVFITE